MPGDDVTGTTKSKEVSQKLTPKELQFCSYVDQIFRITGELPTFERCKNSLGFVNRSEYDRMWNSRSVRTYLQGIGVDVERATNNSDVLTPIQLLVINTLLDFNDPRPDHKKLKDLQVPTKTFSAWKRDPAFKAYLRKRVELIVGDDTDEIDRSLFERARDGDIQAIKYFNEVTGRYRPAVDGAGNRLADVQFLILKVQEILLRNLQNQPELLRTIAAELEALANNASVGETVLSPLPSSIITSTVNVIEQG